MLIDHNFNRHSNLRLIYVPGGPGQGPRGTGRRDWTRTASDCKGPRPTAIPGRTLERESTMASTRPCQCVIEVSFVCIPALIEHRKDIPHVSTKDDVWEEYFIRKGSSIFVNIGYTPRHSDCPTLLSLTLYCSVGIGSFCGTRACGTTLTCSVPNAFWARSARLLIS